MILKAIFWASLGGLAWTHVGYPVTAAALRRVRSRPVRKAEIEPTVTVIVPAHNEEDVIQQRVENLLELDYPADRLQLVVASDGSTDRTDEIVEELAAKATNVRLLRVERAGKATAQNRANCPSLPTARIMCPSATSNTWYGTMFWCALPARCGATPVTR